MSIPFSGLTINVIDPSGSPVSMTLPLPDELSYEVTEGFLNRHDIENRVLNSPEYPYTHASQIPFKIKLYEGLKILGKIPFYENKQYRMDIAAKEASHSVAVDPKYNISFPAPSTLGLI